MTTYIREARSEDTDFVASSILTSQRGHLSRGWLDIALGTTEEMCLAFAGQLTKTQARSWWHLSHFLIAEVEGVAAAALCGRSAENAVADARVAIDEAARAVGLGSDQRTAIWQRGSYAGKCWMPGDNDAWIVEHVATKRSHRRRGLSLLLLEHILKRGGPMAITERRSHPTSAISLLS
jgi:GNAT superfamily N-acetyltransferase